MAGSWRIGHNYYILYIKYFEMMSSVITFIGLFLLIYSIVYILWNVMDITRILIIKEGKKEFGKYGLLYLSLAVSYLITYLIF